MHVEDLMLSQLLEHFSEESLYRLLLVTQGRARKQALRVRAGEEGDDLKYLRALQMALESAHERKLRQV